MCGEVWVYLTPVRLLYMRYIATPVMSEPPTMPIIVNPTYGPDCAPAPENPVFSLQVLTFSVTMLCRLALLASHES